MKFFNKTKLVISSILSIVLVFSNVLVVYANTISDIEKQLHFSDYEGNTFVNSYDELLNVCADSVMRGQRSSYYLSPTVEKEVLQNPSRLYKNIFDVNLEQKYDLNNLVDILYLVPFNIVMDGELVLGIDLRNITYSLLLDLDYEDYYATILDSLEIDTLTDFEKVWYIEDYICNSFTYDYDFINEKNSITPTLESAVNDRDFICGNYAVLLKDLLNRANVNCLIVLGKSKRGELHAFNLVELEDKWYWLDTTWNDESNSKNYFLKGSKDFLESHEIANIYKSSLVDYTISDSDYDRENKLVRPRITNIRISKKNKLHIDCELNSASSFKIYKNKTRISNNEKISIKNNDIIKVQFNDNNKTEYKYQVIVKKNKNYLLRL